MSKNTKTILLITAASVGGYLIYTRYIAPQMAAKTTLG